MLFMTKETLKRVDQESLELLIKDAVERIQSNPDFDQYVEDQKRIISMCKEELSQRD